LIKAGDAGSESGMTVLMINNIVSALFGQPARYLPIKQMVEVILLEQVFLI